MTADRSNSPDTPFRGIPVKTVKCTACHGSGTVDLDGWESDCIDCQGWGDIEIFD